MEVALLAEGVDRNSIDQAAIIRMTVALLAEGVDRNSKTHTQAADLFRVALLAEGVDRNTSF